jgi:hypothetical protein
MNASEISPGLQVALSVVPAVAAAFAGIGLILNSRQIARTNAQARATIIAKLLERFTDEEDMQRIFYDIEYSQFSYDPLKFHGSDEEKRLDKLLMHLATAALAWRGGLLHASDLAPIQYLVRRVLRDAGVMDYLAFVDKFSSDAALGEHPYIALREMGKALEA